jgi:hypothetical protein
MESAKVAPMVSPSSIAKIEPFDVVEQRRRIGDISVSPGGQMVSGG